MKLAIKRVYDHPKPSDGYRVLVDRLWPRGLSKDKAALDAWLKEAGPSNELRKWFGHDPTKFDEFSQRYRQELADNPALDELRHIIQQRPAVTLLYGALDAEHNQAVVLLELLQQSRK